MLAVGSSFMGHSHKVAMDRAIVRAKMPRAANGAKGQVRTKSNRFASVLAQFDGKVFLSPLDFECCPAQESNMDRPIME